MSNDGVMEFLKLGMSKSAKEKLTSNESINNVLTETFDATLIFLKIIFILYFTIMALMHRYVKFIIENPGTFTIETIFYGICGAIPFLFMEKFRRSEKEDKKYITMFTIMFLLYAFFNIVLEIGGFYKWLYEEDDHSSKEGDKHHEVSHQILFHNNLIHSSFVVIGLIIGFMILSMILITYKVYEFKIVGYGSNNNLMFSLETLIFGLCNSVPFFLVAYNREKSHFNVYKNTIEVLLLFIKFVILHILLQGSGFYKHSLHY
jgi:hypothetical protein